MKKHFTTIVCASVLLGATSVAFAGAYGDAEEREELPAPVAVAPAPEPEPETAYWYLGAGAVYSIENEDFGGYDMDNGWGYNVRAGRRLCSMFAAELQWEHVPGGFEADGGRLADDTDTWAITANGKFYPVTGRVQPFALMGLGYEDARSHSAGGSPDDGGFAMRFGIGLDVLITDNVGVAAQVDYLLGVDDISRYDQIPISLGFFYNFL